MHHAVAGSKSHVNYSFGVYFFFEGGKENTVIVPDNYTTATVAPSSQTK